MTVCTATVLSALVLLAERQPLDRYQSVIDRQMFGALPPGFDPTKPPSEVSAKDARAQEQELTKEQEQVKSSIHFSVINVTPSGDIAVGFTDNGDAKSPKHYYLKVGESRDGWTVKEADPLAATMTIAKTASSGEQIEVSLSIGGNSANGGTTKGANASAAQAGRSAPQRSGLLGGRATGTAGGIRGLGSLRERRALREQQRAADAQAAADAKKAAEEKEAQIAAERAAEKEQRDKERDEQRAQLLQIQEELRKAREARAKEEESRSKDGDSEEQTEAQQ